MSELDSSAPAEKHAPALHENPTPAVSDNGGPSPEASGKVQSPVSEEGSGSLPSLDQSTHAEVHAATKEIVTFALQLIHDLLRQPSALPCGLITTLPPVSRQHGQEHHGRSICRHCGSALGT